MTTLEKLYNVAEQNNIRIDNIKLTDNIKALSVKIEDVTGIAIDLSQFTSDAEAITTLAHELGHCNTNTFYTLNTMLELYSRYEYRADKWAINYLIPKQEVQNCFEKGLVEVWQLAEHFNVTEKLVRKALYMYYDIV